MHVQFAEVPDSTPLCALGGPVFVHAEALDCAVDFLNREEYDMLGVMPAMTGHNHPASRAAPALTPIVLAPSRIKATPGQHSNTCINSVLYLPTSSQLIHQAELRFSGCAANWPWTIARRLVSS